jgi:hypothetical protein
MFNCHSEKIYHIWLALDLAGISLALCGCYIPSVYYAFYCQPVCKILLVKSINNISLFPMPTPNPCQQTFSNSWVSYDDTNVTGGEL